MKMSKGKVLRFNVVINELADAQFKPEMYGNDPNGLALFQKFIYAMSKNVDKVESEVKAITKQMTPPKDDTRQYQEKLNEIQRKYADRDNQGRTVAIGNNFVIGDKLEEYISERDKLRAEFKTIVEILEKLEETNEDILREEIEIEIHQVSFKVFPWTLTLKQQSGILCIAKENDEEMEKTIDDRKCKISEVE